MLADEEVDEVTVPLVAMRARVSVRTVYRHFPTKEALFDAFGEWGEEHLRLAVLSYPETLDEIREMAPAAISRVRRACAADARAPIEARAGDTGPHAA